MTKPQCPTCRDSGVIAYSDPADWEPCDSCPRGAMRAAERHVGGTVTFLPRAASAWCLRRAHFARTWAGTLVTRKAGRRECRYWVDAARAFRLGEFNGPARVALLP